MKGWGRLVSLGLALALSSLSCGGYRPIRWPRSDLWTPSPVEAFTIQLPDADLMRDAGRVQKDNVSVAVALLDPQRTKETFHADLVRHGVQPLMVVIHNGSDQPYVFHKADVGSRAIPAGKAARRAYVHPTVIAARFVKWLFFLIPGLVFESIVEPASTLDFPGIEEAARRPSVPPHRAIRDEFARHEIADTEIGPGRDHTGVMFVRPPKLGSVIPVTLVNARTQQPLVFEMPTPPPVYTALHEYGYPYEEVWDGAVDVARHIVSWKVLSNDKAAGVIAVRKGWFFSPRKTRMTIAVQKLGDEHTQVTVQSPLRRTTSVGYGEHSRTIDRFFDELDKRFLVKALELEQPL